MNDYPNVLHGWGQNEPVLELNRDIRFELMLVAVEENSGRWMILETIEWGQKVQIQVDTKMPINSRLKLREYKTWCSHNESKNKVFLLR